MNQLTFLNEIYHNSHQLTLIELRKHLNNVAMLGIVDELEAMWATKEVEWDIDHLIAAVDHLNSKEIPDE